MTNTRLMASTSFAPRSKTGESATLTGWRMRASGSSSFNRPILTTRLLRQCTLAVKGS